ncbi:MAG: ABC transporter permease [Brooklawnia sp.]|uniref:ABC transporter permease n=1 Tax=Brooklawnia sp. TaxID=2699740 RepID=UPI003C718F24
MNRRRLAVLATIALLGLAVVTSGDALFAFSGQFDRFRLPTVRLPGRALVLICAGVAAVAAVVGRRWSALVGLTALVVGFIGWAAAGSVLPFLVGNQVAGSVAYATPLVLGGLGGLLCERAGVVNISIEGQFLLAAFASTIVASVTGVLAFGLLAGVLAGLVMAALLAFFSIQALVGQVMLGIVLNLLAVGLTGFWSAQIMVPQPLVFNSAPVMNRWLLAGLAAASVPVVWLLLFRTKWGLRVRAVGEHPPAVASAGLDVRRLRWQAVLVGGAFAGLGGCFFTLATVGQFSRNITSGYGFIALAALIMGRWQPGRVALMALGFGFVMQLAGQTQTLGTPVNSQLLLILPYVATIVAVAGVVGRVRAPAASGQNYQAEQ